MFIEHVNLTVSDLEHSIRYYCELFDFVIRWQGFATATQRAAHVGNETYYLALFQAAAPARVEANYDRVGLNHFGLVVESLAPYRERLARLGTPPHAERDYDPGLRLYFFDPDGIEIELVEYRNAT